MTLIKKNIKFRVELNDSKTYFVMNNFDDCILATYSKVKAINMFNRISKASGI